MSSTFHLKSGLLALSIAVFALSSPGAAAKTLFVEKWGEDTATCGSKTAPCLPP